VAPANVTQSLLYFVMNVSQTKGTKWHPSTKSIPKNNFRDHPNLE